MRRGDDLVGDDQLVAAGLGLRVAHIAQADRLANGVAVAAGGEIADGLAVAQDGFAAE